MKELKYWHFYFACGIYILWFIVAMCFMSCSTVNVPKKKGYMLTPNGLARKDTLTTVEKRYYRAWADYEKFKFNHLR